MAENYHLDAPMPFASVGSVTRGVLRKAGLQSVTASDTGIGVGSTNNLGAGVEVIHGGLRKTGAGTSGFNFTMPLTGGQQQTFPTHGAIQFDIHKEDFLSRTPSMGGAKILIDLYDGATSKALVVADYVAQGSTAGDYRQFTDTWSGTAVYTRAAVLRASSGWAVSENPQHVIHDSTTADSDGYVTVTVAWDASFMWWYINDVLVSYFRRKDLAITPTMVRFFPDTWQVGGTECAPALRNVILRTNAPMHPNRKPNAYRVQLLMHSFGCKGNSQVEWDPVAGAYWPGDIGAFTCAASESLISTLRSNSAFDLAINNTSKSGQATGWMAAQVTSSASADGRFYPASNNTVTPRFRPHFAIFCGHLNDGADTAGAGTTAAANVHSMIAACVGLGIVPVFVLENNGDITGTAAFNHSANVVPAIKTQIATDLSTYTDFGYVNFYDATGGATVSGNYLEHTATPATAIHNNYAGQSLMGRMLSAEVDRLIQTPPAYAWWK